MGEAISIVVVDDDPGIRDLIAGSLGAHGYQVFTAPDARAMDRVLGERRIDLVILDVLMPGENGISACRRLMETHRQPVIMLSAMDKPSDRVAGLDGGADYYLGKPCNPRSCWPSCGRPCGEAPPETVRIPLRCASASATGPPTSRRMS